MSRSFEELTPQNFSFNSPLGWCPGCQGLGTEQGTNLAALIPNPERSLLEGAVLAWPDPQSNHLFKSILDTLSREFGIPLDLPYRQLDPRHQRVILYGTGDRWLDTDPPLPSAEASADNDELAAGKKKKSKARPASPPGSFKFQSKGLSPAIEEATRVSFEYRQALSDLVGETACSVCQGTRIRDDAAAVKLRGRTLPQVTQMSLREALAFFEEMALKPEEKKIAGDLLNEVIHRLKFLVEVGLDYLTLDRPMPSLSGGESQRIRLAGQIGRALTGVLYVLDEPTIGLHPRDNHRLIGALHRLRDLGNTVVLVEHDKEVLEAADNLYDFGPGSGRFGGQVVGKGTPKEFESGKVEGSLTGDYLSAKKVIPIPKTRRMERRPTEPAPTPAPKPRTRKKS